MKCKYLPCKKIAKSEAGFCITCQADLEFVVYILGQLSIQAQLNNQQFSIPIMESLQAAAMVAAGIRQKKASIAPKLVSPEGRPLA